MHACLECMYVCMYVCMYMYMYIRILKSDRKKITSDEFRTFHSLRALCTTSLK